MVQGILLIMLGIYTIEDIRKRKITTTYLVLFAILGILLLCREPEFELFGIITGVAVGAGLLGISILTGESIGKGDGMVFLVTGIFLGGSLNLELLFISLLYAAIFSIGILIFKRGGRKQEIPFIPFVFLGYLTMVIGELL